MPSRSAVDSPDLLDAFAASAGRALACGFSSSAEYEAAVIAERRAAGRYGSHRKGRAVVYGALTAALILLLLLI